MPAEPFQLTIPAHVVVTPAHGAHSFTFPLKIVNSGTQPATIVAAPEQLTVASKQHPVSASAVRLSRPSFTIRPGRTITEHVRVNLPASATGTKVINIEFRALPLAGHGNLKLAPAVADTVIIREPGPTTTVHATAAPAQPLAGSVPARSGHGDAWVMGGIGLALITVLGLWAAVRSWRRPRRVIRESRP